MEITKASNLLFAEANEMQDTAPNYKIDRQWQIRRMQAMPDPRFFSPHKIKAFARFKCFPEMVLFTEINGAPSWAVDDAISHFAYRFPTFVTGIYQEGMLWIGTMRRDVRLPQKKTTQSKDCALAWLRETVGRQCQERNDIGSDAAEDAYSVYFNSQYIESRRNLKLQKRLMPSIFIEKGSVEWKSMREARFAKPNTTLKDFVGEKKQPNH